MMTTEEMVDFYYWRQVRKGKSRKKFFIMSGIKPLKRFWTKETTEELMDVASILEQVDSDEWVLIIEYHRTASS